MSARPELKLLFDQNLPSRFLKSLSGPFPGCAHVKSIGVRGADDAMIWDFAKANGYAIVSKDADFHHMSFLYGAPPKVVWLRCGNCAVDELEAVIRANAERIWEFLKGDEGALLVVDK